ncbi:MAG: DNA methyltransferase [Clostridium perfringens]|nr:DNA methyltransferase [Clostridium perfringens]
MDNRVKLYKGDCLKIMNDIPDKSVDMILCDLPYGTTDCEWDKVIPFDALWNEYKRIITDNGVIALFGSQPFTSELILSNKKMFRYEIIWEKVQGRQPQLCNVMPMKAHENICVFYKDASQYKKDINKYINLRNYFKYIQENIGLATKEINKILGHRRAEHCFRWNTSQWSICTEKTYNELISIFNINRFDKFKEYYLLKRELEQYNQNYKLGIKYNPQFSDGKAYNKKEQTKIQGSSPIAGFDSFKGLAKENETKRYPLSYIRFKNPKNPVHPTQKPIDLLEWLIKTYTNNNEIILDNCMGSGSTGVASLNTNRRFIGIEKDDKYFDIAKNRINQVIEDKETNKIDE